MTSTQEGGISSDRIRGVSGIDVNHLQCYICHDVLWKPVACQLCETPVCLGCINRWLSNNPNNCPNRCEPYQERKCPPFILKLLAELKIDCFYKSTGCQQVISYEALDKHEIECDYQLKQCPGCQSQILKKDSDNHTENCASIKLTCEDCKLVYKRGEAARKHSINICLKKQLQQVKEESNKNRLEMHALTVQLYDLFILNPSLGKSRITFDDLPSAAEAPKRILSTYRGLKWTQFCYGHESYYKEKRRNSGYVTAFNTGCGPHIAFFKNEASTAIDRPNETFTFISLTACAAWNDDLQLTITGYRNSTQVNTRTATLLFGQPQLILLQWKNIDKIAFKSSGGTGHPGNGSGAGSHTVITQLTIDLLNSSDN